MPTTVLSKLGLGALSIALTSCGGDCLIEPCPLPQALTVRVTDATTSGPVNGAALQVSGALTATVPCSGQCFVPGYAGTYILDVAAPGFESKRLTIAVQGTNPACGCRTVVAQHVDIALSPAP